MPSNYKPKTKRGQMRANEGGGKPVAVKKSIIRPGIKGRWFKLTIREKHAKSFPALMRKYIKDDFVASFPH